MQQQIFANNIKCAGCAVAIKNALATIAGISAVEVDVATGRIDISGESFSLAEIQQKLAGLGYPVQS